MSWNSFFSTTRQTGSRLSGFGATEQMRQRGGGLGGDQRAFGLPVHALDAAICVVSVARCSSR